MADSHTTGLPPIRTVCFTGHRVIPAQHALRLPDLLERTVVDLIGRGATVFRAGGAMGFDTVAALKVLELRERYPHVRLELVLPCRDQTKNWLREDVRVYEYILQAADSHRFLFDSYVDGCMLERDRRLVNGSDVCVAYLTRSHGGTAYTFSQAVRGGLETVNLYDDLR
jgi:uncharacterized phage-like protein YoqJ